MAKSSRLNEAASMAQKLLSDPSYLEHLKIRLMDGSLPSNIEALLFHYAFGKPVETIAVEDNRDIERMSDDELLEAARVLRASIAPKEQEGVVSRQVH